MVWSPWWTLGILRPGPMVAGCPLCWVLIVAVPFCQERWGRGLKCKENQGRKVEDWSTVKHQTVKHRKLTWRKTHERQRISTGLQTQGDYIGRQTRVTRETQLEPLKQWLSNKMGGDRQSTWEHMAPTNNKPCALHTETSGGQPGHTSRTVTKWLVDLN